MIEVGDIIILDSFLIEFSDREFIGLILSIDCISDPLSTIYIALVDCKLITLYRYKSSVQYMFKKL